MFIDDAYLKLFIRAVNGSEFEILKKGDNLWMCRNLDITRGKLQKLLDLGLKKGFLKFNDESLPTKLHPTPRGFEFAGVEQKEVA